MGSLSPVHWGIALAWISLLIPVSKILRRAGHSRWWAVLALVPVVNLIGLWLFAYSRWPMREGRD